MTEEKEQLVKEYLEWVAKFEDANHRLKRLLPPPFEPNASGKIQPWILTEEMLIEYSQVDSDMDQAWSSMKAICEKLTKQ